MHRVWDSAGFSVRAGLTYTLSHRPAPTHLPLGIKGVFHVCITVLV
jgi:hypothetical protein